MNRTQRSTIAAAILAAGILHSSPQAQATSFTAGDLVIDRVGTGAAALTNASTAVYLDEFSILGTSVQSIAVPTTVTQSGNSTVEGFLTRSADGNSLILPGYSIAPGTTNIAGTTTTVAPRSVSVINSGATLTSTTTLGTAFSGGNIRGAASADGITLFATGSTTGLVAAQAGTNGSTIVSTTNSVNQRVVNIFGGNVYYTTNSATTGLYQVTGTPTTTGNTAVNVLTVTNSYGFSISSDGLTAYVAGNSGSANGFITKYTRGTTSVSFTATTETITTGINGVTAIAVSYGVAGVATIYGVTPTTLFSVADTGAAFGTATTLATAGTNTAFRGLDFAPVPEPATWAAGGLGVLAFVGSQRRRLRSGLKAVSAFFA